MSDVNFISYIMKILCDDNRFLLRQYFGVRYLFDEHKLGIWPNYGVFSLSIATSNFINFNLWNRKIKSSRIRHNIMRLVISTRPFFLLTNDLTDQIKRITKIDMECFPFPFFGCVKLLFSSNKSSMEIV